MKRIITPLFLLLAAVLSLSMVSTAAAFSDVSTDAWYAEAVAWCRENEIMGGTSDSTFAPDTVMSRAMLATVLYRAAGSSETETSGTFADVLPNSWYTNAVAWVSSEGLMEGYGNGLFGTNDPVTREQIATILWRYEGSPNAENAGLFADSGSISDYAIQAVNWARATGIVGGVGSNRFDPKSAATRAQVASILYRYLSDNKTPAPVDPPTSPTGPQEEQQESNKETISIPQVGYTLDVPASYQRAANRQGTVERLDYDSQDYVRNGAPISKTAYVYLPYGYDASNAGTRYNIIYLMHGMGGHAGEYFEFTPTKNMFDNLIENGDIPPVIIVSATFYTENSARDFSGSINELRSFHLDFENHLMAAVEGKYHTYAENTTPEGLMASRNHRIFGGFSLGSVTTWLEFCYDYDYISYFLPMSGSCWYYGTYGDFQTKNNVDFIEQLVKDENLDERGYFIYQAVGTDDMVRSQTLMQAEEMLARPDVFTPNHYVFYQKDGGYHDFNAVQEFLYNALPLFFRDA